MKHPTILFMVIAATASGLTPLFADSHSLQSTGRAWQNAGSIAAETRTTVASSSSVDLLQANFTDKTIDASIGIGGAVVGEPVSVSPAITAIVRSAPFVTPSLEIGDNSSATAGSAIFEFIGGQEITTGLVLIRADLVFQEFEEYGIGVREQGGAAKTFVDVIANSTGDISYLDASGPGSIVGSYQLGVSLELRLAFDMDAGTYRMWLDGGLVVTDAAHGINNRGVGSMLFGTLFDSDTDGMFSVDNISVRTASQCTVCGDANGNGFISSPDVIYLANYMYKEFAPPPNLDCADADDYEGATWRDLKRLVDFVFVAGPAMTCPPANGPIIPLANTSYSVTADEVFPANASTFTLHVTLDAASPLWAVWLPLKIRVEDQVPTFGPISVSDPVELGTVRTGDIILLATNIPSPLDVETSAGNYLIAQIELNMSPVGFDRSITIEGVGFPDPAQYPMILSADMTAWDTNLPVVAECSEPLTGDVDVSGNITSADIIYLVNYVFKSGPEPQPCVAVGDVNCTGDVTSADVIFLVNHTFKSGPEPCTVCVLIGDGTWTCP